VEPPFGGNESKDREKSYKFFFFLFGNDANQARKGERKGLGCCFADCRGTVVAAVVGGGCQSESRSKEREVELSSFFLGDHPLETDAAAATPGELKSTVSSRKGQGADVSSSSTSLSSPSTSTSSAQKESEASSL